MLFAGDNTWAFKYNLESFIFLRGSWIPACDKKNFPYSDFSDEFHEDINRYGFLLYDEMYEYLEDLLNSMWPMHNVTKLLKKASDYD